MRARTHADPALRARSIDAADTTTHTGLLGGGGVDGAIHRAAGPGLLAECRTLAGCATGDAKLTAAHALPCEAVVHAVGPVYTAHGRAERAALLARCYRRGIELAVSRGLRSVAFAALSTGVYGYPSEEAAFVVLREVRALLEDGGKTGGLERVVFCNFADRDVSAYEDWLPTFFPPVGDEEAEERGTSSARLTEEATPATAEDGGGSSGRTLAEQAGVTDEDTQAMASASLDRRTLKQMHERSARADHAAEDVTKHNREHGQRI